MHPAPAECFDMLELEEPGLAAPAPVIGVHVCALIPIPNEFDREDRALCQTALPHFLDGL